MNDVRARIRAIVHVQASNPVRADAVTSERFVTRAVRVAEGNSTLRRFASTMARIGRAQFDAVLLMGESVRACIEKMSFSIRSGSTVLMRSPLATMGIEVLDAAPFSVMVRARHGYNTQLAFGEKVTAAGARFGPNQVRDLFVETFRLFAQE